MKLILILFCIVSLEFVKVLGSRRQAEDLAELLEGELGQARDMEDDQQYQHEVSQGDLADLFSTNIHKAVPIDFNEFSRRFVVQYPYVEVENPDQNESELEEEAENQLEETIKKAMQNALNQNDLRPIKAPPEVVLAIVKQSLREQQENPVDPDEFVKKENLLRSTNEYWDSVWQEDVPKALLDKPSLRSSRNALKSVRVKIMPGSNLYKMISATHNISPRLLYIVNSENDEEVNK